MNLSVVRLDQIMSKFANIKQALIAVFTAAFCFVHA